MHFNFYKSPLKKNKKAFALLMSLFLMGFLVLLVITLSAIVSTELKASKQLILDQKAKNAAKFAAYQALSEVQKSLGADQRITANAKILDTQLNDVFDDLEEDEGYSFWDYDPAFDRDNVNSIEGIANPLWLGVWNSTPGYYPIQRSNSEDRYSYSERILGYSTNFLVSGNRSIKRDDIIPSNELDLAYSPVDELSADYINMLRKNSITDENGAYDTDTMRVRVPLVTLPKTDEESSRSYLETRIAWWVSDESQKAPVNVIASEDEFDIMNNNEQKVSLLQTLPFKNGMQAMSLPYSETGLFYVDLNDSDDRDFVRRLNDVSQLDLLLSEESSSVSAAKFLYNSVAMNTKGLAVNVRSGGLKKDLSVGLLARNPETLRDNPNFFDRPMGVEGYDAYLTNPLEGSTRKYNIFITNSSYNDKKGHMFGPQAVENIDLVYTGLTYTANDDNVDDVSDIHKDPGGPLWESLRDYYNNRVDKDGIDIYESGGYANTVKTKTDVSTGLSPVLLHYQLFSYPTLTSYSGGHGVRIYIIPMVVLWNPYDIDIREGSTFAFSAGRGSPSPFGSYRVAVGTITDGIFEAIRDIRTETMPRPLPNAKANGMSYISNASFSEQATEDSLNLYRAVSLDDERIGIVSVTDDGMNDSTMVASGHIASRNPINKSYFGYGHWRYEDTKSLVSGVEDSTFFPSSGDNGLDKSGLVRIYNEGTYSDSTVEMGTGGSKVSVYVPEYYYLSTDSFYYRKLYLNNVKYSISWTGQSYLGRSGAYIRTEDEFKTSMFTERAHPAEDPIRFLVKCEEALKGGEAKIFTLKESVPYHYKFNGNDGYAGVLAMADQKGWYLTEGVDKDSIGGLFIDIMHAERTHLASNKTTIGTSRILSYNIDDIKNIEFDPQTTCDYDGKELGVLFDLSDGRYYGYSDESEEGKTVSIDDIYIDIDHFSEEATGEPFRHYVTPWYMKAESAFNPNPWYRSGSSTPNIDDCLYLLRTHATDTHNFSLQFSDLMMWNYEEDDNDSSMGLYTREDGNDGIVGNIGAGAFQNLKRYVVVRSEFASPFTTSSFPDPIRVKNDTHSSSNYQAYFFLQYSMVPFHSSTFGESPQIQHPTNTGSDSSEQYIFVGSNNSGTDYSSYDINQNYTSNADKETILTDFVDVLRDKVRGRSNPLLLSSGNTIYDGYYKSLMQEINFRIILAGASNAIAIESNGRVTSVIYNGVIYTTAAALYNAVSSKTTLSTGIYTDDDYETFLEDMDLYDKYAEKSWIWEDPYFLLRNPRRVAYPRWTTKGAQDSTTSRYLYWSDNIPKAVNVQSAQIVESTSTRGLSLNSELLANDGKSLMSYECVSAYRPMSAEIESDYGEDWFFQYPFKFPWLAQTNTTAKVYADGRYGNAGAFRDRSYGTDGSELRGGSSVSACSFFGYGAIGNNLQYSAAQYAGEEGTEGNFKMGELFSFYINKFGDKSDGQVQIGPDVLSEDSYKYTTKHYLRKYEVVASPADLATADLVFGAEQSRNFGTGTATSDMYYPDNLIGSSYSPMRVAPERPYDYVWIDAVDTVSRTYVTTYNSYGDGIRNTTAGSYTDEIRHVNYDIAWLLNDLLWDEYFFSSIPYTSYKQNDLDAYYEYLVPKNPRIEYINKYKDKIYTRVDNDSIIALDYWIQDDDDLDYDFDANASRFWIKGAFNVNSTDVDAWKMVLGTSFGNPIYGFDGTTISVDNKAPFPRNGAPYTAEEFDKESVRHNEKTAMQGFRALTRVELEELALSLVENIKDRGPFFSLADFMNRSVELRSGEMRRMATETGYYLYDFSNDIWDTPKDDWSSIIKNADEDDIDNFYLRQAHMQKGVIQSAIDLTSINSAFFDEAYLVEYEDESAALNSKYTKIVDNNEYSLSYSVYGDSIDYTPNLIEAFWADFGNPRNVWENYRAILGSTLAGAPTYLSQIDIIKQIGSFITVRGDTFKIRAYGEIRNPLSEEIQSKAWCEMLVQRYPEYIDNSANVDTDVHYREKELGYQGGRSEYDSILTQLEDSPVNIYLGRRFKVVSFKWLSESEI